MKQYMSLLSIMMITMVLVGCGGGTSDSAAPTEINNPALTPNAEEDATPAPVKNVDDNPTLWKDKPLVLSTVQTQNRAVQTVISTDNKVLYVINSRVDSQSENMHTGNLQIIDIKNLEDPKLLYTWDDNISNPVDIVLSTNTKRAYVLDAKKMLIVDMNDSVNPRILSDVEISNAEHMLLSKDGTKAYISHASDGGGGLYVVDISDESSPTILATLKTPSHYSNNAISLSEDGNTLYSTYRTDGNMGLEFFDVSNPNAPTRIVEKSRVSFITSGDIAVHADKAYVACGKDRDGKKGGFQIFDISDVQNPLLLSQIKMSYAFKVSLSQDAKTAYVVDSELGLLVIDTSNPNKPFIKGSMADKDASDITLASSDKFAVLAREERELGTRTVTGKNGLKIINLQHPSLRAITSVQEASVKDRTNISSDGSRIYTVNNRGLIVSDAQGKELKTIDMIGEEFISPVDVALSLDDKTLYIADEYRGLWIVSVWDLDALRIKDRSAPVGLDAVAVSVALSADGTKAYLAYKDRSVTQSFINIIDLSSSGDYENIGTIPIMGWIQSIKLSEDGKRLAVHVSDRYQSLQKNVDITLFD